MARGSVLVFSGRLYLGYTVSWIRQEENQFLACPREIARALPEDLLRLMGYRSDQGYGHPGDRDTDPIQLLTAAP